MLQRYWSNTLRCLAAGLLAAGCSTSGSSSDGARIDAGVRIRTGRASQPLLWPQLTELSAPTPIAGMQFGNYVDIDGDRAIVAAPTGGEGAGLAGNAQTRPGQAFIYVRQGDSWVLEARLTSSDRADWDEFGSSVAIDGDLAAVGATCVTGAYGDCTGEAYVFERDPGTGKWSEVYKILAADADARDLGADPYFGQSIDLDGGRLVVSAYKSEPGYYNDTGSVYLFEQQGDGSWAPATVNTDGSPSNLVLEADTQYQEDQFGINCRISGDTIVVGAFKKDRPTDGGYVTDTGAVYVFQRQPDGTWPQVQRLIPDDLAAGDQFGVTVSIDGDTLAAGTVSHDVVSGDGGIIDNAGAAYVYRRQGNGTWTLEQQLAASDAATAARFGNNVAVSGNWLLVGSPRADGRTETFSGKIYLFQRQGTTWTEDRIVTPMPEQNDGSFGYQVALDGNVAIAGAQTFDDPEHSGRAFIFEGVAPLSIGQSCSQDQRCDSGHCEDGVCCDSACGQCQACVESKTGKPDGTCAPIPAGEDPDSDCTDPVCAAGVQTGNECDGAGACDTRVIECDPYRCAAGGGVCAASCMTEMDCVVSAFCDTATNVCKGTRPLGDACTRGDQCASNNCVDGYCCNSACDGQCEACDVEGSLGTCAAVTGAPHGARDACVDNGDDCAGACDGKNRVVCTYPGDSTTCADSTCDGTTKQPFHCNGAGECAQAATVSCSPFVCGDSDCRSDCTEDDHCASGFICQEANCVPAPEARCSDDGSRKDTRVVGLDGEVLKDCAPYLCVSGQCAETCSATGDCKDGYYCDREASRCRKAGPRPSSLDLGLFCAASTGPVRPGGASAVFLLAAAGAFGARRRRRLAKPCRMQDSSL